MSVLLGAALALALPGAAHACSMCVSAQNNDTQTAFAIASLFLSATPLSVIGGVVWYIRRRERQLAAEEEAGVVRLPLASDRSSRRP